MELADRLIFVVDARRPMMAMIFIGSSCQLTAKSL